MTEHDFKRSLNIQKVLYFVHVARLLRTLVGERMDVYQNRGGEYGKGHGGMSGGCSLGKSCLLSRRRQEKFSL